MGLKGRGGIIVPPIHLLVVSTHLSLLCCAFFAAQALFSFV